MFRKIFKKKGHILKVLFIFIFLNENVYANGTNSSGTIFMGAMKLLLYIIIFAIFLLITVYGTRYLAKNFTGVSKSRFIKCIDRISLTSNFNIFLIEVFDVIYVIANTDNDIEIIDTINKNSIEYDDHIIDNIDMDENDVISQIKSFLSKEDKDE